MPKNKPYIVVIGSCYVDMAVKCERFPNPGETISGSSFSISTTGCGVNHAMVAANCGCDVSFVGKVGSGSLGDMVKQSLEEHEINTDLLETANAKNTGAMMTFVNSLGENCSCIAYGANNALRSERIESVEIEQAVGTADLCIIDGSLPREVVESALMIAKLRKTKTILSLRIEINEQGGIVEPLPIGYIDADILVPEFVSDSNSEDYFCTNAQNVKMVGAGLISEGFKTVVISTLKKGCYVYDRSGVEQINSYEVEIVDSTCSRDAFAGALAASVAAGDEIKKAVKFAHAAALITGSRFGGQETLPKKEDIIKLLFEQPD